jgi:hypoxanthine phosphoribosyltransferase
MREGNPSGYPGHGLAEVGSGARPGEATTTVKVLIREDEVREGVRRLATEINARYEGEKLTIVGVMTGSVVLLADLIRQLNMPLRVGVMQTSSYGDGVEPGELRMNLELMLDVRHRHVLLVDDIFDTGRTLEAVLVTLRERGARSVQSAVLLRKLGRQQVALSPDFVAFEIPDAFVVGYGLDYRDEYRNLPYIAALEPHDITAPPT